MGLRWAICFLMVCSACLHDNLVVCGDTLCPSGSVCTPGGCAAAADALACSSLADGASCSNSTTPNGTCAGGSCHLVGCGNGIIDPGEVCDDGDQRSGDGCSADCSSRELCGNGVVDVIDGEQCDVGLGGLSSDGCSSLCALEVDLWRQRASRVLARTGHATAYDSHRHRVVMFGGIDDNSTELDDTWEWDGANWNASTPPASPPARSGHAMAYDVARQRVVLFGGDTFDNDTWEWDGVTWMRRTAAASPPPRKNGRMAYDAARHETVLFGGVDVLGTALGDTWVWDGTTWSQKTAVPSPSPREGPAMAFDPSTNLVMLYGDLDPRGSTVPQARDTWSWDGVAWMEQTPGPAFSLGSHPTMAYDAVSNSLVLIVNGQGGSVTFFAWVSGPSWRFVGGESGAWSPTMDFDGTQLVRFGGTQGNVTDETWLGGVGSGAETFTPVTLPVTTPPGRDGAAMIFDGRIGRPVLVGGEDVQSCCGTSQLADTWEWTGAVWSSMGGGPGGNGTALAYDSRRGVIVAYANDTTWERNGTTWSPITTVPSPGPRSGVTLTYDRARGTTVLFGGAADSGTWEWNGSTWSETNDASASPPDRTGGALGYDQLRDRVVLFGGTGTDGQRLGDTWEWNGAWGELTPAPAPAARNAPLLTYDDRRHRVVLFGGRSNARVESDLWEWDGTQWTQREPIGAPPPRSATAGVYDPIAGELTLFGGQQGGGMSFDDMWSVRFDSLAHPQDACTSVDTDRDGLAGCADPDCAARCVPDCPSPPCTGQPFCGDGACDALENYLLCPSDCMAP